MTNARCLTEGVDVPAVDMVAFMSPKERARSTLFKPTGRAMRNSKKGCRVLLIPLYLEQEAGEGDSRRYQANGLWRSVERPRSDEEQDEELADIIRELRTQRGRTKGYDDSRFAAARHGPRAGDIA